MIECFPYRGKAGNAGEGNRQVGTGRSSHTTPVCRGSSEEAIAVHRSGSAWSATASSGQERNGFTHSAPSGRYSEAGRAENRMCQDRCDQERTGGLQDGHGPTHCAFWSAEVWRDKYRCVELRIGMAKRALERVGRVGRCFTHCVSMGRNSEDRKVCDRDGVDCTGGLHTSHRFGGAKVRLASSFQFWLRKGSDGCATEWKDRDTPQGAHSTLKLL